MMQQPKAPVQQQNQNASLLPGGGQQAQPQSQSQQQLMSQLQSQPTQLQQQMGLQQQTNSLQHNMQPRMQTPNSLLSNKNMIDQQKQFPDSTAQTTNAGDWQEEVYQKIKTMKDMYFTDLNEMYQKISLKLQQQESLPQQTKMDQLEKLKMFKTWLEKEKLPSFEKQIIGLLSSNRPRRPAHSMQPGQILPPQMQSMQQVQQSHSQISQTQSHEVGVNPQLQSMNLQGSVSTMQQSNVPSLQHGSVPSLAANSSSQQSMPSSLQTNSNIDSGQGTAPSSMQQVAMASLQQNSVSAPQQANISSLQSQSGAGIPGAFPQHLPTAQRFAHQQLKPGASFPVSSSQTLQAVSPQINQHSPQIDQQNLQQSIPKNGTPLQSANSPFVPSPSTPLAPSPMPNDAEKPAVSSLSNPANIGNHQSGAPAASQSLSIGTPGISPSPLFECAGPDGTHGAGAAVVSGKSCLTEQPLDRLLKAVKSISPKALNASVCDIGSVVSMVDRIAGSAPGNGSRATVGEDLVAMTKCRLQARNFLTQDGSTGTKRMRRYTSAMPLNVAETVGSMNDNFKQLAGSETSELESTATSSVKKARTEVNHTLLEEIREINERLIDTVVDVNEEDSDPSVAASASESRKEPLSGVRLVLNEHEDLSVKAKSRFSICLRSLSQPMSLKEIARTWDDCARAVICEYAQQNGGGTFSSKYGTWENV
ncbi:Mediator of RNA polymerase II transcription subunit 15a [Bienertia sinuspersici]